MSVYRLENLFKPRSVAVVGLSRRPRSVGAVLGHNLATGGFQGPLWAVHPSEPQIAGLPAFPSVEALPETPELAVIATPATAVPELVERFARRGTPAAVIVSGGFAEIGGEGAERQARVVATARAHGMRLLGPNCVGLLVPGIGLNASFAHMHPRRGDIALVSQSGAIVTSVLDWASARGIGFSHMVSLGDMADADFGDVLDYLAADPGTRAILLYVEALTEARKFMSAARAAARTKPLIVIKGGRSDEAAKAAASHTGALAGSDEVYDTAFRRAGMLRVKDLDELFDAVQTLGSGVAASGDRLAILTNGGGVGVLAVDTLIEAGGRLAELAPETLAALDAALPATWSRGNPVDIIGDADGARYQAAMAALMADRGVDAVVALNCPTAVADSAEAARGLMAALPPRHRPVFASWLGAGAAAEARRLFAERRIPSYETPDKAVRAFMHLVQYRRNQELLMQVPPSEAEAFVPDTAAARAAVAAALAAGRDWLDAAEVQAVMAAYRLPLVRSAVAADAEAAAAAAAGMAGPLALKIVSPDVLHKSDVGGVALWLNGPAAVREAAKRMAKRVETRLPGARIEGFAVQEMARLKDSTELILGVADDPLFGPVILFGEGGVAVEVIRDRALGLPPLNAVLARDLMARTRVWRRLQGYRDRPPARIDAVVDALVKVSQLVADIPEVRELDINPLIASAEGVVAVDARIRVGAAAGRRLAIRPYPKALERRAALPDGLPVFIRPMRPEDAPLLQAMVERMTPNDIRLRFFTPLRRLPPQMSARLTQIDYDREMALAAIAEEPDAEGRPRPAMLGGVRISADPDNRRAEYAVAVRSDMKGRGLGRALMEAILAYAASRGIGEVYGEVLRENVNMLALCDELGFQRREVPDEPGVVEVRRMLRAG